MSRFPLVIVAGLLGIGLAACSDPDQPYRDALAADVEHYERTGVAPAPEEVPMPTRSVKAEALAEMGGRATPDDIQGRPGDDPAALREVKDSFVAYYNLPYGAEGEREAWIRVMRAMERAEALRGAGS